MKTLLLSIFGILFFTNILYAQVGIGNTAPKSILDIQASNQTTPANTDGLLIPRIDAFPSTDPGADQDGMLVFLTTDDTFYFWNNGDSDWLPLYSESSSVISGSGQHYVGELWGGGIVIYMYQNGEHGLVASLDDMTSSSGVEWGLDGTNVSNCESIWDGETNTDEIIDAGGSSNDAAGLCDAYSNGGFSDWYLPSVSELKLMYDSIFVINSVLEADGDSSSNGLGIDVEDTDSSGDNTDYWSSTEKDSGDAYIYKFKNGHFDKKDKQDSYRVRAIRSF